MLQLCSHLCKQPEFSSGLQDGLESGLLGFLGVFVWFFSFSCSVNPDSTGERSEQLRAEDLEI